MNFVLASALGAVFLASSAMAADQNEPSDYQRWKQTRTANLTAEKGWLTLVGLHWIDVGKHTIGAGANQTIRLAGGPQTLGTLERTDAGALILQTTQAVQLDGKTQTGKIVLTTDRGAPPSEISIGSLSFFVIDRSGRLGLRVKDTQAKTRTEFKGLSYFPYLPSEKITAKYVAYDTPKTIEIATVIGTVEDTPNPGRALFDYQGKSYQFELLEGSDAEHFFTVFGDKTNGAQTYGMARFLTGVIDKKAGTVTLDFNTAYNPPCAFTEFATCPMPPPSNRIAAKVLAGELRYGARD
jgi:uncharacterized protein